MQWHEGQAAVRGGDEETRRRADTHTAGRGSTPSVCSHCLPGITEIVFKALNTLNVRRAETLPRSTNSVTYLQDQIAELQNSWRLQNSMHFPDLGLSIYNIYIYIYIFIYIFYSSRCIFKQLTYSKTNGDLSMHTYAMTITQKSNQFHGSLRKVNRPTQKPLARILMRDSKVYIPVNVHLRQCKRGRLLCKKTTR